MSGRHAGPRNVPALLNGLSEEKFTGTVLVSGSPGGTIHLRQGLIASVETPGAPTPESILLRSGRVDDAAWALARTAPDEEVGVLLAARGLLGREEFEVVCTAAVFDGAFALALSPLGTWEVHDPAPAVIGGPAVEPHRLAAETTRRMALLAQLWGPPAEFARTRIRPTEPASTTPVPPRYAELLGAANGRRTPRDIAFALGRGLYPVMLDLGRMRLLRLVRHDVPETSGRPSTAPRTPDPTAQSVPSVTPSQLPRRTPGAHDPRRSGGM
ncbi:hypothetical protein [Streptomyces sp. NPDC005423]|uniref:hypothetical protein n=1 Tax=Streptomyces sp. NPDC005423 TaxID=3155343 RepID=UPI0033A547D9